MFNIILITLNELLDIKLISTERITLTVYHLTIIILIILITYSITWTIKRVLNNRIKKRNIDIGTTHAVFKIFKYLLWIIAGIIILEFTGINLTFLLAGSAALLVGLGFGLQEIFRDIVSGIFILFEGTLKVNDVVELSSGIIGRVKEIGLRSTKVETRNNTILIIPNSKFINENLINWSHIEKRTRFQVDIGVAYGSDVILVKEILQNSAKEHENITSYPQPFVQFNNFGDSALEFQLFFWTDQTFLVENIKSDLRFTINQKLKENGVVIPFPQRDVHIKTTPRRS